MTIQQQYDQWVTKVYGGMGLSKVQREEMRKAFFCGAFVMINLTRELSELPQDIAVSKLELLNLELINQIQEWTEGESHGK